MQVNRKTLLIISRALDYWRESGLIDGETADRLRSSLEETSFDWRRLAKYAFGLAVVCFIISLGYFLLDEYIIELIKKIFSLQEAFKAAFFALLSAAGFYLGFRLKAKRPEKVLSSGALLMLGVASFLISLNYVSDVFELWKNHSSLLLLPAVLLYGALGLVFRSRLVWACGLFMLVAWFGLESDYVANGQEYFFGMSFSLRYLLFGAVLTAAAVLLRGRPRFAEHFSATYSAGLSIFFISLWVLSMNGNRNWTSASADTLTLVLGGAALALASAGSVLYGWKRDDGIAKKFGIIFFFLNIYVKYYEFCFDVFHRALFFFILAVSFILIGRRAENIWNLRFLDRGKSG